MITQSRSDAWRTSALTLVCLGLTVGACNGPAPSGSCAAPTSAMFAAGAAQPQRSLGVSESATAYLSSSGRIASAFLDASGNVILQVWSGSTWNTEQVYANDAFTSLTTPPIGQGSAPVGELSGQLVVASYGQPAGSSPGLYAFTEQADGKFAAPELIDGSATYVVDAIASNVSAQTVGVAAVTSVSGPPPMMLFEKASGGTWQKSETGMTGYILNAGYETDGTPWIAYVTNLAPSTGVIQLIHRVGSAWSVQAQLYAPATAAALYNPIAVASSASGHPQIAALWENAAVAGQASVSAVVYDFTSGVVHGPFVVSSGISVKYAATVFPAFAFTESGSSGVYSVLNSEGGSLSLGAYSAGNFSTGVNYLPSQLFGAPPGLVIDSCDQAFLISWSKAATASSYGVQLSTLSVGDYGGISLD